MYADSPEVARTAGCASADDVMISNTGANLDSACRMGAFIFFDRFGRFDVSPFAVVLVTYTVSSETRHLRPVN
jgi:hypothetical protein